MNVLHHTHGKLNSVLHLPLDAEYVDNEKEYVSVTLIYVILDR